MDELKRVAKCDLCGKGVMHTRLPFFYRLRIERFGIKMDAVQRQHGLELVTGHAAIAAVLGPNEEAAVPVMDVLEVTVCEACAMEQSPCFIPATIEQVSAARDSEVVDG